MVQLTSLAPLLASFVLVAPPDEATRASPADVEALGPFFEALAATEAGDDARVTRIAWWGDSAIVGDGYTGRIREVLQRRFGDGGPGFILAEPSSGGYLRRGVRMKRHHWDSHDIMKDNLRSKRYGLGGVRAWSHGGAGVTFEAEEGAKPWDLVEVYHQAYAKGGTIQLFFDESKLASAEEDARVPDAEDRVWRTEPVNPASHVRLRSGGKGGTRIYGVVLERKGPAVVLDTLGVLGARARRLLNNDSAHFADQITKRRPDLLVLNFGGNERVDSGMNAENHAEDIKQVLRAVKKGAPGASCLVVGPIPHGLRKRGRFVLDPALADIYAGQRVAAKAEKCAFLDTIALLGGDDSVRVFRKNKWIAGDLSHLKRKGHEEVGDRLATWLVEQYLGWKALRALEVAAPSDGVGPGSSAAPSDEATPNGGAGLVGGAGLGGGAGSDGGAGVDDGAPAGAPTAAP